MLILRDVYYSAIDENGEERLFSANEIMTEEEYLQKLYAESKENKLIDYSSKRGLGRAALLGSDAGVVGRYAGIKAGEEVARRGGSDSEALRAAELTGAGVGAGAGVASGIAGYQLAKKLGKSHLDILEKEGKILKNRELQRAINYAKQNKKTLKALGKYALIPGAALGGAYGAAMGARGAIKGKIKKRDKDDFIVSKRTK